MKQDHWLEVSDEIWNLMGLHNINLKFGGLHYIVALGNFESRKKN